MGIFTEQSPTATESYVSNSVSTVSGSLNTTIQNQALTDLADTPESYTDGYYLVSTVSGTEWSSSGYYNLDGGAAASVYGGISSVDGGNASSF